MLLVGLNWLFMLVGVAERSDVIYWVLKYSL